MRHWVVLLLGVVLLGTACNSRDLLTSAGGQDDGPMGSDDGVATGDTGPVVSTSGPLPTTTGTTVTTGVTTDAPPPVNRSGLYLWPVETVIAPGLPLQYLVVVEDAGSEMFVDFQPLSLNQGSTTEPRLPQGTAFSGVVPVEPNGTFQIDMGEVFVPAFTNPITGSDLLVQVVMTGGWLGEGFACGLTDGNVLDPIMSPLTGSTFAAIRVDAPDLLPVEFPVSCG